MYIQTIVPVTRIAESVTYAYPQGMDKWLNSQIYGNGILIGDFQGSLYLGDGVTKAFEWENYEADVFQYYGTRVTKLAFLNRLGDEVMAGIELASRSNTQLGIAAAIIKLKHQSSTFIDLSLPETSTDIQKLVALGFISQEQSNSIINTPVTRKEVPSGFDGGIL
jgi:hypothetical protein